VAFRPAPFRVEIEVEVAVRAELHFLGVEVVAAQQEVGLVEPVFAGQPLVVGEYQLERLRARRKRNPDAGLEGGEVNPFEAEPPVDRVGVADDFAVALVGRPDDELRRAFDPRIRAALLRLFGDETQRFHDVVLEILILRKLAEVALSRRLDVERNRRGELQRPGDRRLGGARNDLEMDVAAVTVFVTQNLGGGDQTLHGAVGIPEDAGGEEDAEQPAAAEMVHEQLRHLVRQQRAALGVAVVAQRAVTAVARKRIRNQRLHHDSVTARRERDRVKPAPVEPAPTPLLVAGGAGAGEVVTGVVRKVYEFLKRIHDETQYTPRTD